VAHLANSEKVEEEQEVQKNNIQRTNRNGYVRRRTSRTVSPTSRYEELFKNM